jgi:hypothetical protein
MTITRVERVVYGVADLDVRHDHQAPPPGAVHQDAQAAAGSSQGIDPGGAVHRLNVTASRIEPAQCDSEPDRVCTVSHPDLPDWGASDMR